MFSLCRGALGNVPVHPSGAREDGAQTKCDRRFVVAVMLFWIGLAGGCTWDTETIRSTSPNGLIDAVVIAKEGRPPVTTVYSLFLVPAGGSVEGAEPAMRFKRAVNINCMWRGAHQVEFQYESASIFEYHNRFFIRVQGEGFDKADLYDLYGKKFYWVDISLRQTGKPVQPMMGPRGGVDEPGASGK